MRKVLTIIFVVLFVLILPLTSCSFSKTYPPCVNQPIENVATIELLDTHDENFSVLYTLTDEEIPTFCQQLMEIEFGKIFSTPPATYGDLSIRIMYNDGHSDIIGTRKNRYETPDGVEVGTGLYFARNPNDFITLFSQYIDPSLLPAPR